MTTARTAALCLPLLLVLTLAACDSSDPIDEPDPADVAGLYRFTTFSFDPDATVLPDYNLLDTLDANATRLQLLDSGTFILTYGFRGGRTDAVTGQFSLTSQEVRIRGSNDQREKFSRILLSNELNLQRGPAGQQVLTAEIRKTVDLAALSSQYSGLQPVAGTLRLTLRP